MRRPAWFHRAWPVLHPFRMWRLRHYLKARPPGPPFPDRPTYGYLLQIYGEIGLQDQAPGQPWPTTDA